MDCQENEGHQGLLESLENREYQELQDQEGHLENRENQENLVCRVFLVTQANLGLLDQKETLEGMREMVKKGLQDCQDLRVQQGLLDYLVNLGSREKQDHLGRKESLVWHLRKETLDLQGQEDKTGLLVR